MAASDDYINSESLNVKGSHSKAKPIKDSKEILIENQTVNSKKDNGSLDLTLGGDLSKIDKDSESGNPYLLPSVSALMHDSQSKQNLNKTRKDKMPKTPNRHLNNDKIMHSYKSFSSDEEDENDDPVLQIIKNERNKIKHLNSKALERADHDKSENGTNPHHNNVSSHVFSCKEDILEDREKDKRKKDPNRFVTELEARISSNIDFIEENETESKLSIYSHDTRPALSDLFYSQNGISRVANVVSHKVRSIAQQLPFKVNTDLSLLDEDSLDCARSSESTPDNGLDDNIKPTSLNIVFGDEEKAELIQLQRRLKQRNALESFLDWIVLKRDLVCLVTTFLIISCMYFFSKRLPYDDGI